MKRLLIIPKIEIQNANAVSSPYAIGFPAMTAWLGGVHALQRNINKKAGYENVKFTSVAVIVNDFKLHTHKAERSFNHSIIGTRNPLIVEGKKAKTPSFVEEGRCNLKASLIIEFEGLNDAALKQELPKIITELLNSKMKFAGGDVMKFNTVYESSWDGSEDKLNHRAVLSRIMPGYAIVERSDLLQKEINNGLDVTDALLKYLKVNNHPKKDEEETDELDKKNKIEWIRTRETKGWIVPIAIGFNGITPIGKAQNQRDNQTPHRFAESVITLGEFIMPHRLIENINNMLWHYDYEEEDNLYLCKQNQILEIN